MALVSILTPTFNQARFLPDALRSVAAQTRTDHETIVVDDGSTDATPDVVRDLRLPNVRYIRQEHSGRGGLSRTYARALREARGKYVALLEGDDYWAPTLLERLLPEFDDPRVVVAYGIAQHVDATERALPATTPAADFLRRAPRAVLNNDPPGSAVRVMTLPDCGVFTFPCAALIRRQALEAMGGLRSVDDGHAVDMATFLSLTLQGTFAFFPGVLGFWRRHAGSANASEGLESMLRADARFAIEFVARHGVELPPPTPQAAEVAGRWERHWSVVRSVRGRHLLIQRRWAEAREAFCSVFRTQASPDRLALAAAGLACTWLRRDLEGLIARTGRGVDLRRMYDSSRS